MREAIRKRARACLVFVEFFPSLLNLLPLRLCFFTVLGRTIDTLKRDKGTLGVNVEF